MKETILDLNPFFGRDMSLMPEEDVFEREIIFEKTKRPYEGKCLSTVIPFQEFSFARADHTLVMGHNQTASWSNSVVIGTADSVGGFDISGNKGEEYSMTFNINKKPNLFRRSVVKLLLGWDWVDKEE